MGGGARRSVARDATPPLPNVVSGSSDPGDSAATLRAKADGAKAVVPRRGLPERKLGGSKARGERVQGARSIPGTDKYTAVDASHPRGMMDMTGYPDAAATQALDDPSNAPGKPLLPPINFKSSDTHRNLLQLLKSSPLSQNLPSRSRHVDRPRGAISAEPWIERRDPARERAFLSLTQRPRWEDSTRAAVLPRLARLNAPAVPGKSGQRKGGRAGQGRKRAAGEQAAEGSRLAAQRHRRGAGEGAAEEQWRRAGERREPDPRPMPGVDKSGGFSLWDDAAEGRPWRPARAASGAEAFPEEAGGPHHIEDGPAQRSGASGGGGEREQQEVPEVVEVKSAETEASAGLAEAEPAEANEGVDETESAEVEVTTEADNLAEGIQEAIEGAHTEGADAEGDDTFEIDAIAPTKSAERAAAAEGGGRLDSAAFSRSASSIVSRQPGLDAMQAAGGSTQKSETGSLPQDMERLAPEPGGIHGAQPAWSPVAARAAFTGVPSGGLRRLSSSATPDFTPAPSFMRREHEGSTGNVLAAAAAAFLPASSSASNAPTASFMRRASVVRKLPCIHNVVQMSISRRASIDAGSMLMAAQEMRRAALAAAAAEEERRLQLLNLGPYARLPVATATKSLAGTLGFVSRKF